MSPSKSTKTDILAVALAVIAWHMVVAFRHYCNWSTGWLAVTQPLFGVLLALSIYFTTRRCQNESDVFRPLVAWIPATLAGVFGIGLYGRQQGLGDSWEVLSLLAIANVGVGLAVLSRFTRMKRISILLSCVSCFLVLAISDSRTSTILAILFGCTFLLWLITDYWKKVDQKLATNQSKGKWSPKATAVLVCIALIGVLGSITLSFAPVASLELPGISWFSGGTKWSDDFGRDGLGDGNQVRSATDMANSFGPVDSDIFMESKQESLFDVASEMYGKPRKPNRNRAIGLDAEVIQHNHSKIARSQKASAEFSTRREPAASRAAAKPEDQLSDALFFVKGRIPMRFAIETYNTYEDGVWREYDSVPLKSRKRSTLRGETTISHHLESNDDSEKQADLPELIFPNMELRLIPVAMRPVNGMPWMNVRHHPAGLFGGDLYTSIKITNLKSLPIPSPPCLEQFCIDQVDKANFFGVGTDGIARLNNGSRAIPEMTVINVRSSGINLFEAWTEPEEISQQKRARTQQNRLYLDTSSTNGLVRETARDWTAGLEHDWEKIDSIISHLRNDFEHDRQATLPKQEDDAASYLLNNKTGSDYMFATTAAQMFRSLEIPSRVVNGFIARKERLDRKSGHVAVLPSDIHVWVEVSLDGQHWIPVEPTPGYPQPIYELTWTQRIAMAVLAAWNWLLTNPLLAGFLFLILAAVVWNYRFVRNAIETARWQLLGRIAPRRMMLETARLIDRRAALAGIPRPANQSASRFSQRLASSLGLSRNERDTIERFGKRLDRILYHPRAAELAMFGEPDGSSRDCTQVIRHLPFRQIRKQHKSSARVGRRQANAKQD